MSKIRNTYPVNETQGKNTAAEGQLGLISTGLSTFLADEPLIAEETAWKPFDFQEYFQVLGPSWSEAVCDLLHRLDDLAAMLRHTLHHASWLNAYLLAAGMNQIVEDYLHPDPFMLRKSAKYVEKWLSPAGPYAAQGIRQVASYYSRLNNWKLSSKRLIAWQHRWSTFVNDLADIAVGDPGQAPQDGSQILMESESLLLHLPFFPPSLQQEVIKLPSCFRSFDQQPEDIRRIVDEFTIHWTGRERDICVVGIRTSGSYLAPLYAAFLKSRGYTHVRSLTLRPDRPLNGREQRTLQQLTASDGLALVVDDPPISGGTLTKTVSLLEDLGLSSLNIVLLLQLFSDGALPRSLQNYPSVLLSWPNWTIHQFMEPALVKEILSKFGLPPFEVAQVVPLDDESQAARREHAYARYRVELQNTTTNQSITRIVQVKGLGLGYFGEHTLSVIQKLSEFSTQVITVQNGLLFQEVPSPELHLKKEMLNKQNWINNLVDYIVVRNQRLSVNEDSSKKLAGRNTDWEVASTILAAAFGRGWPLARALILDRTVKKIMTASHPSVIDGDMDLSNWYAVGKPTKHLAKMDLAERDFSHLDLYSYDPVYDLACIAQDIDSTSSTTIVRRQYETITGDVISPERWMLNQLVHIWDKERLGKLSVGVANREKSRVVQRYFAELYFSHLEVNNEGPLCAIDLDGVLETNTLGFPSLSHSSALALRALSRHGYRPILVTGRSLEEVIERCDAYPLAGGVAEYGSVLYDKASGKSTSLLTTADHVLLDNLRACFSAIQGVHIDHDYEYAVRAYCLESNGKRVGLPKDLVSKILVQSGIYEGIRVIPGNSQTDFIVESVNKGRGLLEWLKNFGSPSSASVKKDWCDWPAELAVGDSINDLTMLGLAKHAFAPAHAYEIMKDADIRFTRHSYQKGFADAVFNLIGHLPAHCTTCQPGEMTPVNNFIEDILSIRENGRLNMAPKMIKLIFSREWDTYGSNS